MNYIRSIVAFLFVYLLFSCKNEYAGKIENIWWKETVFYEIYMPSYKDGNGDGYSDFKGVTSKLDYIEGLGGSIVAESVVGEGTTFRIRLPRSLPRDE